MYKTVVLGYHSKAKKMAASIEDCANLMGDQGFELISFSVTGSGKAILVFKDNTPFAPVRKIKKNKSKTKEKSASSIPLSWDDANGPVAKEQCVKDDSED